MTNRVRFGDFILGLEGLAILRSWLLDPSSVIASRNRILRTIQGIEDPSFSKPIDDVERPVISGYTEWAESYDNPGNPILLAEQPAVRALLADLPAGIALDAACGTGRHAEFLDHLGHEVIGIDVTPAMLEVAREKVPNARFETASLTSIPLPDESADLVVCGLALTHCRKLHPPVRELARVLRPGGSLVISDVHPFVVMLGGHAGYSVNETERAFVRNYVHLPSDYLSAFHESGLTVVQFMEPLWGDEEIAGLGLPEQMRELGNAAVRGMLIVVVWELNKPR